MLKLLHEWFILFPGDLIAYLVLVPIGFGPLIATYAVWFYLVKALDGNSSGKPKRFSTYFIAGLVPAYVLAVTATALVRLPHVYYLMTRDDD